MSTTKLNTKRIELPKIDSVINKNIPSGFSIRDKEHKYCNSIDLSMLKCAKAINLDRAYKSIGTLGGGNHFIEIDKGIDGCFYLVIHSGSRRLGKDVALYHMAAAFFAANGISPEEAFKRRMRFREVNSRFQPGSCFLSGEHLEKYLHDMNIAVLYAELSRKQMGEALIEAMGLTVVDSFITIHNYIDTDARVLRKGAVSAQNGELLIIPINMRDGSLICRGKGNAEWNYTAPHGSGRLMKRSEAKECISLEEYRESMRGVFSTSVNESTIDESPMAYRSIDDILDVVEPTVEIIDMATPVYNFKASKGAFDEETADGQD